MKPGPDLVVACPHCGCRARVKTVMSGNTFGARWWTDGKFAAAMLPLPPPITPCRRCGQVYWWEDSIVATCGRGLHLLFMALVFYGVPLLLWLGAPPAWVFAGAGVLLAAVLAGSVRRHRALIRTPAASHYLDAIDAGVGSDRDRELVLRIHAWWAANDPAREQAGASPGGTPASRSGRTEASLRELHAMLDPSVPRERLLKAEAARELGDFTAAVALLDCELPADHARVARRIRELAAAGDTRVAEVDMRDDPGG